MAILRINNFGGEIPRLPARALPAGAAQINSNLLATATEFRPLQSDSVVGAAPAGTKTLYRLSKGSNGVVRTSDAEGWITDSAHKNYVKGQVNDDGTERTYVTFNDGTQQPRAIDALGANRVMGVPAPFYATAVLVEGKSFTAADAVAWSNGTLVPALHAALLSSLPAHGDQATSRVSSSLPVAGAYSMYGMTQNAASPWLAERSMSVVSGLFSGLNDPTLDPQITTSGIRIQVLCLPFWGRVSNTAALAAKIRLIENPRDGTQLFPDNQISSIVSLFADYFNPDGDSIKTLRVSLDVQVKAITSAIDFVLHPVSSAAPSAPVKPTTQEYGIGSTGFPARSATWVAYDASVVAYTSAMRDYTDDQSVFEGEIAAKIASIVVAKAAAARLTSEIDRAYIGRRDGLAAWVKALIDERGLIQSSANESGLVEVDADRIVESRFYIATYVNDWGEESAPSAPTEMLDVDQYTAVTVGVAPFPSGRNLVGWRIYRSNVGSSSTAFQAVTDKDSVVSVLFDGGFDYFRMAKPTYSDSKKGAELGEVCPTTTWAEPPYRMQSGGTLKPIPAKGADPYLRGLVGMPNGVMAGHIDNFVAFCDPYHPYAWPVEYQIPLKYQIVGLGVFGQSLFVGTTANPSIISGSDSASMSEQVLDDSQSCVSARSIVSMAGGVLYASPDGICFADNTNVQVITSALFAREDWQALMPSSLIAEAHEGIYYFWFSGVYGGLTGGCLALDTVAKKLTRVDIKATAIFADHLSDAVFYVSETQIKRAFGAGRRIGKWKSSKVIMPAQAPLAWLQVDGNQSPETPATVRWYGDGQLRYTAIVTGIAPTRLPPGRWLEHEIEIESTAIITRVTLAGHTLELQQT